MANCKLEFPEEVFKQLAELGDKTDDIVKEMLREGSKICANEMRTAVKNSIGKNTKFPSKSTGKLAKSIKAGKIYTDKKGLSSVWVSFSGTRGNLSEKSKMKKNGKHYLYESDIAYFLEYGTSKMTPKPFMNKSKKVAQRKAIEEMTRVFENEVNKHVHDK